MEDLEKQETFNEEVLDDTQVDTSKPEEIDTASSDNESYADNDTVADSTDELPDSEGEEKKVVVDNTAKQEAGKISWLEKEKNNAQTVAQKANQKLYSTILTQLSNESTKQAAEDLLRNDPELFETFREQHNAKVKSTGTGNLLPDYQSQYNAQPAGFHSQGQMDSPTPKGNSQVDDLTFARRLREIESRDTAVQSFLKKVPEMRIDESAKGSVDDYEYYKRMRKWNTLAAIVDDLKADSPELTYEQALTEAWNSLPQNRNKQIKQAEKIGEMAGMAAANGSKVGVSKGTSSYKNNTEKDGIPDSEKALMKKMGMSDEDIKNNYPKN